METKTKTDIKTNTFAADAVKRLELRIVAAGVEVKKQRQGKSESRQRTWRRGSMIVI